MAKKKSKVAAAGQPKVAGGRPGPGWFTKSEMASILDMSQVYFDKEIRKLAPANAIQQADRRLWFHARPILESWAKEKFGGAGGDEDEMLAGPPSDQLEEYRKHKARIAKVEADRKEEQCVYFDDLNPVFARLASRMMQGGEQLKDRYGNDAVDIFNRCVTEAITEAMKAIGGKKASDVGGDDEQEGECDSQAVVGVGGAGDSPAASDVPSVCGAGDRAADGAGSELPVSG